jgi:RNA-directed DNA polymerase
MERQKQKTEREPASDRDREGRGGPRPEDPAPQIPTASAGGRIPSLRLMEWICEAQNLREAWKRVKANKGAPGIDAMTVEEAHLWLQENIGEVKRRLLAGE